MGVAVLGQLDIFGFDRRVAAHGGRIVVGTVSGTAGGAGAGAAVGAPVGGVVGWCVGGPPGAAAGFVGGGLAGAAGGGGYGFATGFTDAFNAPVGESVDDLGSRAFNDSIPGGAIAGLVGGVPPPFAERP